MDEIIGRGGNVFRWDWLPVLLVALAGGAVLAVEYLPARLAAATVLVCLGPGLALTAALFPEPGSLRSVERLALAMGASYAISIVGMLGCYYLFGALRLIPALAFYLLLTLLLAAVSRHRAASSVAEGGKGFTPSTLPFSPTGVQIIFLSLLLVAAVLRFSAVNYADFKGDEADVLLGSIALTYGEGQPLFEHTKGPGEMLTPAAFGLLGGRFDEFVTRFPFALAGTVGVVGVYLLGRRMFDETTALVALAFAAIDGLFLHYARTAQYQSLVFVFIVLAVYCYYRYYQDGRGEFHLLGTLLLTAGALTHYETILVAPLAVYLTGKRLWADKPPARRDLAVPAASALLFLAALAAFYVPFALHPHLDSTAGYLSKRIGQEFIYNNFEEFYINALTYSSLYYVALVDLLLIVALARQAAKLSRREIVILLGAIVLGQSFALAQGAPQAVSLLVVYLALLALWLRSQAVSVAFKALLCWLALPFLAYMFLVERPGSHYYIYTAAFVLLAASVVSGAVNLLKGNKVGLIAGAAVLAALYAVLAYYPYLLYLRHDYEYMLTYPQHKSAFYVTDPRFPFGQRIGFGFPYRLGWQMVGHLYRTGVLDGDWDSDDEGNSLTWYTLGIPRNPCFPRYYFLAEIRYKEEGLEVPQKLINEQYVLKAQIWDNGQLRLKIYEYAPGGPQVEPLNLAEPASYDSYVTPEMFHTVPYAGRLRIIPHPMAANLADKARLVGYDLDTTRAAPGGSLVVTLYWQAAARMTESYKVFTHLESERLWSQADDVPACHTHPTQEWEPGEYVVDRHVMPLPPDLPPGEYPLLVGMYEPETGQRLEVAGAQGPGNGVFLQDVTILAGE
jgi:hypothetical protein